MGVTGHRILTEIGRIRAGIERAVAEIERHFPGEDLVAVSSLAEGGDLIAAQIVLARPGWRLTVPLPLPRDEYLRDFESEDSKREFLNLLAVADPVVELPPQPSRSKAHKAAGLYVLDHCDVLIAVWDGREAQGSGGTAEMVADARRRRMPIAWVHAGNRKPGTNDPTSLGEEQGSVTFENFSSE